jgi:hypothetical protein
VTSALCSSVARSSSAAGTLPFSGSRLHHCDVFHLLLCISELSCQSIYEMIISPGTPSMKWSSLLALHLWNDHLSWQSIYEMIISPGTPSMKWSSLLALHLWNDQSIYEMISPSMKWSAEISEIILSFQLRNDFWALLSVHLWCCQGKFSRHFFEKKISAKIMSEAPVPVGPKQVLG